MMVHSSLLEDATKGTILETENNLHQTNKSEATLTFDFPALRTVKHKSILEQFQSR